MHSSAFRPALVLATLLLMLNTMAQTADKLKTKVRIAPDPANNDKRTLAALFPTNDRTLLVTRLVEPESGVLSYERSVGGMELYDRAKLNLLRSQEPKLQFGKHPLFLESVVRLGRDPVMIASRRDTLLGTTQLYWQKADPNLTQPHRPFEELCVFDTKVYGDGRKIAEGRGHRDAFITCYSPDSTKILLYSPAVKNLKGDVYRPMVMLDKGMTMLWKQTLEVSERVSLQQVQVDNAGNVYLLERNRMAVKDMKKDTTSFFLTLHRVSEDGIKDGDLGLGKERFLKNGVFKPLDDGTLLIAGMYTGLDGKEAAVMGDMLGRISPGGDKVEVISTPVFVQDADDATPTKKGIRVVGVQPRKDGGFFLIREYFLETSAVDAKTSMAGLRWIHGPVVVSNLDAKGKELWSSTFRRLLYSTDAQVGEVFSLLHNDQLVLFLVDSDEQVEKRKAGEKKLTHMDLKTPFSTSVVFDGAGVFKAKAVLRSTGANDFLVGRELYRSGPSEYYMVGSHKLSGGRTLPVRIDIANE